MKGSLFFLILFLGCYSYGQSINEIQGKWQFVKIEFSGPGSKEMDGEGPADSCIEKNTMEFIDDKITTTIYFDQDCKEFESETFRFRIEGNKLEFWSEYNKSWDTGFIKRFSGKRFVLINEEEGLKTSITLKKI